MTLNYDSGSVIKQFGNQLIKNIASMISKQNMKFLLFGNYNVNLLKTCKNNYTCEHVNDLLASSVTCLNINKPTTITSTINTLIDHIYTDDLDSSLQSGINISSVPTKSIFFSESATCWNKAK